MKQFLITVAGVLVGLILFVIVVPMVRSPVDTMNACQRVTDRAAPVRLARCFPRPLPRE